MIAIARKLITFLDGPSRLHLGLLFLPMLAVALLEMASIGMILPLIQVLIARDDGGAVARFVDLLLPGVAAGDRIVWIAGLFSTLFVIKNMALFLMIFVINRTIQRKLALFLQRLFVMYLNRPFRFHLRRNSAEIIRNLNSSAGRAFESIRLLLMMLLEVMLALVALALLLAFEPGLTLAVATILFSVGFVYHRVASPHFQGWGANAQILEGRLIKAIAEALGSIRDVKLLHVQGYLGSRFALYTNSLARYFSNLTTFQHLPRLIVETLVVLGFTAIVISMLFPKQRIEDLIALLGLFGMAALRLMPSANRILSGATDLKNRLASVDVLYADLMEARNDEDELAGSGKGTFPFAHEIKYNGVSFYYPGGKDAVIRSLDLSIARGESVGIVGANGAGKSTLIDIVLGLLKPTTGVLSVDGRDIRSNVGAWQKHLGYVPQRIYLVDDTLRRNIAFGVEDAATDDRRIREAVAKSNLGPVIEALPEGLDARLGEGGSRLSGGQRQRVAIARALYRDPDVLIFDEATAALDRETETEVTAAIDRLKGQKTLIIVSHKLDLVRNCDKIVFMKEGRIIDVGRFDDLIAGSALFRRFAHVGETPSATVAGRDGGE